MSLRFLWVSLANDIQNTSGFLTTLHSSPESHQHSPNSPHRHEKFVAQCGKVTWDQGEDGWDASPHRHQGGATKNKNDLTQAKIRVRKLPFFNARSG